MKINKTSLLILIVLIIACAFYRVWNNRPGGFAPQIAMALFAGSVIKDKRFSFLFPLLSMLVSDAIYQVLYVNGMTNIQGFYHGQWLNYLLIGLVTVIGFFINQKKIPSIFIGSLAGVAFYFIVSNFFTWTSGLDINNQPYPKTFDGFIACYTAALPFLKWSIIATLLFNGIFFGSYQWYAKRELKVQSV